MTNSKNSAMECSIIGGRPGFGRTGTLWTGWIKIRNRIIIPGLLVVINGTDYTKLLNSLFSFKTSVITSSTLTFYYTIYVS